MSESAQSRLRSVLEQLVKSLPEDQREEALRAARVLERLTSTQTSDAGLAAPVSPIQLTATEPDRHHQAWVEFLSRIGVTAVPRLPRGRERLLQYYSDLIVFVPGRFREAAEIESAMREYGLRVVTEDGAVLDFHALAELCPHPGWTLIDRTLLGGPPISEEQKVLRMEPLENAPRHMPVMDLASFLAFCAFLRETGQPFPRGKWTLAGSRWAYSGRSAVVECRGEATVVVG